jgi:hypothetical protein
VDDLEASIKASWALGYPAKKHSTIEGQATSIGPDGYRFNLLSKKHIIDKLKKNKNNKFEPFLGVKLNVGNMETSKSFYTDILGMKEINTDIANFIAKKDEGSVALGYESPDNSDVNCCVLVSDVVCVRSVADFLFNINHVFFLLFLFILFFETHDECLFSIYIYIYM